MRRALRAWVATVDLIICRVPTPAAWFAFRRRGVHRRAAFVLLVVGDLEAVGPTLLYRGDEAPVVRRLYLVRGTRAPPHGARLAAFANGAALADKHRRQGATVSKRRRPRSAPRDQHESTRSCRVRRSAC